MAKTSTLVRTETGSKMKLDNTYKDTQQISGLLINIQITPNELTRQEINGTKSTCYFLQF